MTDWKALSKTGKVEAIRANYVAGESMAQLAAKVGAPRNGVIGVYNRHPRLRQECPPRERYVQKTAVAAQSRRDAPRKEKNVPAHRPIARDPVPAPVEPLNLELWELDGRKCHWPVNDGGPFLFCGQDANGKYCAYHSGATVSPVSKRPPASKPGLRRK